MRRSASTGVVLILAASLFFGVCGPFAKSLIAAGMSAVEVTWLRVTGTGLILMVAAIPAARRMIAERRRPPLFPLIGFGLTAIAGVQLFYFLAVARLPVGVALLLEFTGPILVVAWIRWIRRVRLPHTAVAGALLSLAGLAFVVEVWAGLRLDTLGLLAGAAAAACQAGYFLAGERLTAQVGTPVLLAAGFGVGILALAPFAQPWRTDWSLLDGGVAMAGWSPPGWVVLAALVVSTASAYACGLPALRMLSAAVAGGMAYTEVVVAAVAAWILLGERLTGWQMFGGLLVVAGVFTAQRAVATREPDPVRAAG
ncbi:threonine/homoserine efflux transporter RhtA [Stackebrandtia albiflava]|uniref:Threonine/homoserine efflux transporter RhtA n=1 Tax=Stackebrandtia albiflava TaxID=406432 RepID=A0A562VB02_9ACTN|nr:EamA family transporter [Stackebrandtia albiflava]TWJ15052.1 threonine/homoserine efflux transporter RhtA [Stackebrandtia albiflava]